MIRPDHVWFFFTVVLSLALAMSVQPRKAEQQKQATAYSSTWDQRSCGELVCSGPCAAAKAARSCLLWGQSLQIDTPGSRAQCPLYPI